MPNKKQDNSKIIEKLKQIIKKKGLNYTKQREIIFETILNSDNHISADDIHSIIKTTHKEQNIGIATVYRALSFLEEAKLITSVMINGDTKMYENNLKSHHDHLVCINCDKIVEFCDDEIEARQNSIASKYGFEITSHTMYLYGLCEECR
jgi:Fur family ferric uptake transcriptional regulator